MCLYSRVGPNGGSFRSRSRDLRLQNTNQLKAVRVIFPYEFFFFLKKRGIQNSLLPLLTKGPVSWPFSFFARQRFIFSFVFQRGKRPSVWVSSRAQQTASTVAHTRRGKAEKRRKKKEISKNTSSNNSSSGLLQGERQYKNRRYSANTPHFPS